MYFHYHLGFMKLSYVHYLQYKRCKQGCKQAVQDKSQRGIGTVGLFHHLFTTRFLFR